MSPNKKSVLIIGAHGQDAFLLGQNFKNEGYNVIGVGNPHNIRAQFGPVYKITSPFSKIHFVDLAHQKDCQEFLDWVAPSQIVHAAAVHTNSGNMALFSADNQSLISSVEIAIPRNIMDWQLRNAKSRFHLLSSSQIFGDHSGAADSETNPSPLNHYAKAKLETFIRVKEFQDRGIFVNSLILFPHSSPYSRKVFLLQEIADQIVSIMNKERTDISIRNGEAQIDISDARDMMGNVYSFVNYRNEVSNCVFGSGELMQISNFVQETLSYLKLENVKVISREPVHQKFPYASQIEMNEKIPSYRKTRKISLTLAEIVNRKRNLSSFFGE